MKVYLLYDESDHDSRYPKRPLIGIYKTIEAAEKAGKMLNGFLTIIEKEVNHE